MSKEKTFKALLLLLIYFIPMQSLANYKSSFISFETKTGMTFSKKNTNNKVYPASLTKLLTAYIILRDEEDLEETTIISKKAWGHNFRFGSRMFIEPGMELTLDQLLNGLLIQSGNDAAVALAEHHSGNVESFIVEMNKTAKSLGMKKSNFKNPNGRHHQEHYTTANDFKKLVIAIMQNTPEIINYTLKEEFTFNEITQYNRNKSLKFDGSLGLKTGFTPQSGYNLAGCFRVNNGNFCSIEFGARNTKERFENNLKEYDLVFVNRHIVEIPQFEIDFFQADEQFTAVNLHKRFILSNTKDEPQFFITYTRHLDKNLKAFGQLLVINNDIREHFPIILIGKTTNNQTK